MNDLRDLHNTDTENFENDLINFLTQLRNVNYREEEIEPQLHEIPNIERMIMRELFLHILNNNRVVNQLEQESENIKFNINLIHNNNNENANNTNNMLENNMMCNICWDEKEQNQFIKFGCNHEFCKDCIVTSLRSEQRNIPCCALCRSEITTLTYTNEDIRTELDEFVI
jgi:hypothetical protein